MREVCRGIGKSRHAVFRWARTRSHAASRAVRHFILRRHPSRCCTSIRHGSSRRCTSCATAWRARAAGTAGVSEPGGVARGINPFDHGSALHTDFWKTEGLKQALDKHRFDAAFGGARRDEEKSRAKERIFSFRSRGAPLGPEAPAPRAVAPLQCAQEPGRKHPGIPDLQLDRARRLAIHPSGEYSYRAAVFCGAAPDRGSRRAHFDGRR